MEKGRLAIESALDDMLLETIAAHETLRPPIARRMEAARRLLRASEGFCGSASTISWMKERGCGRIKAAAFDVSEWQITWKRRPGPLLRVKE